MNYPTDFYFQVYQFLCGGLGGLEPLKIGEIPSEVAWKLQWRAKDILLSRGDAQKIRFHSDHGMRPEQAAEVVRTFEVGDFYQQVDRGTSLQIVCVRHEDDQPKRCFFSVLARDEEDRAIHLRTFFKTSHMSRNKLSGATTLFKRSDVAFFKGVEGDPHVPQ